MVIFWGFLFIAWMYLLYRLRIYFFFYPRRTLLATMNSFLNGRALEQEAYYQLHCIPQSFLFKQIEKNYSRIHWNPASIQFLHYSGFLPYYLKQKRTDPFLISCLWDLAPDVCQAFIRTIYPELPLTTQAKLLFVLIKKDQAFTLDLVYLLIRNHSKPAFLKQLIGEWDTEFLFQWFETKIQRPDFSYVFFSVLPLIKPAECLPSLIRLLPRFNTNHKLLLMDCIASSTHLEWLPLLNILNNDEPLISTKAAAARKELLNRAQNRSCCPSLQRREDPWKYLEQFASYLLP